MAPKRPPPARSVECLGPLAQGLPLLSIMAAHDGGTARLKTPYLRQRPHKHLRVPGVARDNVAVERGAQAERIGGKQEPATAVERNERAHRPLRMAGERHQHNAPVTEKVPLATDRFHRQRMLPFYGDIASRQTVRRPCSLQVQGMHDHRCLLEECIATAVIGMQVRVDDEIDVFGTQSKTGQTREHVIVRTHDGCDEFYHRTPPRGGVLGHARMAASVEQHVALRVPQEDAQNGQLNRLIPPRVGQVNAFAHAQTPAGEDVHLHGAHPLRIDPDLATYSNLIASPAAFMNFTPSSILRLTATPSHFANCEFAKAQEGSSIKVPPAACACRAAQQCRSYPKPNPFATPLPSM